MARQVRGTAAETSERWQKRMKASIPDMQAGVERVQTAPGELAAAKADKMLQNLTKSVTDGRWGRAVAAVPLGEWKQKTKQKMGERVSGGVDAAMGKRQKFDSWMHETINGILPEIDSMPDLTIEDSINRMTTFVRKMSNKKYKQ